MSFDDSSCSSSNPSSPSGYDDYEHFSGSSSPPPSSSTSAAASGNTHKDMLKSLQMKFTYLKEPRKRTRTTPEQLEILITFFDRQPCPSVKQRKQLAEKTGMTPRSIQVWFQNRRAKFRLPAPSAVAKKASSPSSPSSSPIFSVIPPAAPAAAPYVPFQSFLVKQEPELEQQQQQQQEQPQQALETSQSPISSPSAYSDASFESFEGSVFEPFAFDEPAYEDVKVIFDPFATCSDDFDVSVY